MHVQACGEAPETPMICALAMLAEQRATRQRRHGRSRQMALRPLGFYRSNTNSVAYPIQMAVLLTKSQPWELVCLAANA